MKSPTPTLPSSETIYYPTDLGEVKERKDRFAKVLAFISARHGFVVSVPGDPDVVMECLPESSLPDDLMAAGYDVAEIGSGERILPNAIVETFVTEGSTVPRRVTHAGICKVKKFTFLL